MKSLIGKRVKVVFKNYGHLEGIVAKVDGNMVFLTEVKDTIGRHKQPDRVINTNCEDFREFVILEKEVSLAI